MVISTAKRFLTTTVLLLTVVTLSCCKAPTAEQAMTTPPKNPFFSDATASTMHGGASYGRLSLVAGPNDVKRPLTSAEVQWRPIELATWGITYSSPYPDKRRVLWLGGGKELFKYDADTLELLASLKVREGNFLAANDIDAYINQLDALDGDAYYQLAIKTLLPEMAGAAAAYKVVSHDNNVYMLAFDPIRKKSLLRIYGDVNEGNADSAIELKQEWVLPTVSDVPPFGFILNISYDGTIIIGTRDGTIYAVSADLKTFDHLILPRHTAANNADTGTFRASDSFLRNAFPVDPSGGIYVVTQTHLHRVQWTGKKLSLDATDGAWSASYDGGNMGSGTTPSLMGWGDSEDKLVIIGDGRPNGTMHLWAFWRDQIPNDWHGINGKDRRVVAIAPVDFGAATATEGTLENSLPVKGYGVLVSNDFPPQQPHFDGGSEEKLFVHYYAVSKSPNYVPRGVLRFTWNAQTRTLDKTWSSDLSLTTTIPVIDINNRVFGIGWRDGLFTVEAIDWATGNSLYHYDLGSSVRYNPNGSSLMVAPNGALDCMCQGGAGLVRIHPQE